jgi:hypothetical protein
MYLFALIMIVLNAAAFGPSLFRRHETPISVPEEAVISP